MSVISVSNSRCKVNSKLNFLPVNHNNKFDNSQIYDDGNSRVQIKNEATGLGVLVDSLNSQVVIGMLNNDGNNTRVVVDEGNGEILLDGLNIVATSAGASAGRFLILTINGITYKIQLLSL